MTNDALAILTQINLALGIAIVAVMALRRLLRKHFGAQISYAAWLLPPVAALATQFPVRLTVRVAASPAMAALPSPGQAALPFDPATALFGIWLGGVALFILYLARTQLRFHDAMRAGQAGPAIAGILRPRIVTPSDFADQFLPEEQDVVLAHERTHLARQDARINALAALLRCLCWFNPLVHIGARLMRMDQEMACDATVMARHPGMRRLYAETLLKSQIASTALPFGCHWPSGTDHPLTERIASLKARRPGTVRRLAGVSAIVIAASITGVGAWAAQPPRIAIIPAAQTFAQNTASPAKEPDSNLHSGTAPHDGQAPGDVKIQIPPVTLQIPPVEVPIAKARTSGDKLHQNPLSPKEKAALKTAISAQVHAEIARQMALLDVEQIKRNAQRQALAAVRENLAQLDDIKIPFSAADKEAINESVRRAMQDMHQTMERTFSRLPPAPPAPPPAAPE